MKKIFILATAAIVALASCTKSEVVYNQGQQEIGFRQFTGAMTKAESESEAGPSTSALPTGTSMGVFSYLTNTGTAYFENAKFVNKSGTTTWGGETPYYWPLQGTLDFTVYAPYQANGVAYDLADNKKLTVAIADNSGEQIDYLYGKVQYNGKTKTASPVSVVLKHALSMVTINVKSEATSVFTVKQIDLLDTYQAGSFTVTYDKNDDNTCTVSSTGDKKLMNYFTGELSVISAGTAYSKLVVPSDQTKIEIKYTMAPSTTVLTAVVDLVGTTSPAPKWETGKHYTYNITLTADEIILVPTVVDWDTTTEGTTVNKEIK